MYGVVADVKEDRYNFGIDRAVWYLPSAQGDSRVSPNLVVQASGDTTTLAEAIGAAVGGIDPDIGAARLIAMDQHTDEILSTERFAARLPAPACCWRRSACTARSLTWW
jgi:hypothetical protein